MYRIAPGINKWQKPGERAWLVNKTFVAVAESVLTMGGTSGLGAAFASVFGTLTLIVILVDGYWKVALWSFSLIMLIPNKALEWAGMQALSDYGQRNVHNEVIGGVANVHQQKTQAIKSGAGGVIEGAKKGAKANSATGGATGTTGPGGGDDY